MVSILELPKGVVRSRQKKQIIYLWYAPKRAIEMGFRPSYARVFSTDGSEPTPDQMRLANEVATRLGGEVDAFLFGPEHPAAKARAALAAERERQLAAAKPKPIPKSSIPLITLGELREHLHYDPATGIFTWVKASGTHVPVGAVAGFKHPVTGYIVIGLKRRMYLAHRLAWLYVTGEWPVGVVDHKNRVRDDNAWGNLQDVTQSVNVANSGPSEYPPDPWRRSALRARRAAKDALRPSPTPAPSERRE